MEMNIYWEISVTCMDCDQGESWSAAGFDGWGGGRGSDAHDMASDWVMAHECDDDAL